MEGGVKEFYEQKEMMNLFERKVGNLTTKQMEYFRTWDRLIDLESKDAINLKKEIWFFTSAEREKMGR